MDVRTRVQIFPISVFISFQLLDPGPKKIMSRSVAFPWNSSPSQYTRMFYGTYVIWGISKEVYGTLVKSFLKYYTVSRKRKMVLFGDIIKLNIIQSPFLSKMMLKHLRIFPVTMVTTFLHPQLAPQSFLKLQRIVLPISGPTTVSEIWNASLVVNVVANY